MLIATTHKNADFDALASVIAARLVFPAATVVLPRTLNPNVKAFLSIHKDLFETRTAAEIDLALVKRLVVVDIAPVSYANRQHGDYIRAMRQVDLTGVRRRALIEEALRRTKGNKQAAARLLGLKRTTLVAKLRRRRNGVPATGGATAA